MATILDEIVDVKRTEVAARMLRTPLPDLACHCQVTKPRTFAKGLAAAVGSGNAAVIAEIKRGSPSLGCIRPDLKAPAQGVAYESGGAAALSVLTDETFFFGSDEDFVATRAAVSVPMLRKEFIIDEYQLFESRVLGADCVLLIMSILSDDEATALCSRAHELGLDVLAETHTREEIERALAHVDFDLIGINNRNLKTFDTRTEHTIELAVLVPDREQLVAESGLRSPDDISALRQHDIHRFLVGEAFVRHDDPAAAVRSFVETSNFETPA